MSARWVLAVLACCLATAGCGSDDAPPTATVPPPVPAPEAPPPLPPRPPPTFVLRFEGVLHAPGQVIELTPGAAVELEVGTYPPVYRSAQWGFPDWGNFAVETDAPPESLSISHWIAWREVPWPGDTGDDPSSHGVFVGIVRVEIPESAKPFDPERFHEMRIGSPPGGFGGDVQVDRTPIRFRVVAPSPAISCDQWTLVAGDGRGWGEPGLFFRRLFGDAQEFASGRITLQAAGFGVGLRLVAPYRFRGGERTDAAWDPSAQRLADEVGFPYAFAAGMELRAVGGGFEQTFELGWFDDLEVVASSPGCEPRRLRCDLRGRCSAG